MNVRRTREEMKAILDEWEQKKAEGMKMIDFAKSKGLYPTALYQWRSSLAGNKRRSYYKRKHEVEGRTIVAVDQGDDRKRIKQLEDENRALKILVADLSLDRKSLIEYAGR